MNHKNKRSKPVLRESGVVASFWRSPIGYIALTFCGPCLLLNTVVHSDFPGSIEFSLAPDDGVHIKINGVQKDVAEGMQ